MRPRIGIPLWKASAGEGIRHYEESVRRAGGEPVLLRPGASLAGVQGLRLTGGADIDPRLYGEERHPETQLPDRQRDEHELLLLRGALEQGLPVLAICRGHQLLNVDVALGGKLLQDIPGGHHRAGGRDSAWHPVRLAQEGLLWELYGVEELWVNSRHHQAVTPALLASRLRPLALADNGALVEAVSVEGHPWAVGVQWHPERPEMWGEGTQPEGPIAAAAPLFAAFIAACGDR